MPRSAVPVSVLAVSAALLAGCGAPAGGAGPSAPAVVAAGATFARTTPSPPASPSTPPSARPAPAPAVSAEAWVDTFCRQMIAVDAETVTKKKADPDSAHPEFDDLVIYIDASVVDLTRIVAKLKGLGPAPTPSGRAAVDHVMPSVLADKKAYSTIKKNLATTDPDDPDAIDRAMAPLDALPKGANPMVPILADAPLYRAAKKSANCRKLEASYPVT